MSLGVVELALLIAVVVLLFGTGRLTRAIGELARGVRVFRDEMRDTVPAEPAARPAPRALPAPADPAPAAGGDQPARP